MATITFYHDAGLTRQITAMLAFIQKNAGRCCRAFKYAFMERFDVPFLGAGVNAMVFRLNTRKVIRLEFDPSPNGHLKWVRYCLKHQTMQSIPRIYVACTVPEQERAVACLVTVYQAAHPSEKSRTRSICQSGPNRPRPAPVLFHARQPSQRTQSFVAD